MRGLLVAQFFGAFNDNAWKYIILTLAMRPIVAEHGSSGNDFLEASQWQTSLALLVFTLPMMIFSLPAGVLADRISKRTVIVSMKILELILMIAATAVILLVPGNMIAAMVVLAMMGLQSAIFSPAKYGILPEILPHSKLSIGNGLLEMWTMLAIIAGTGLGPLMLAFDRDGTLPQYTFLAPAVLVVLAVVGLSATRAIPPVRSMGSPRSMSQTTRAAFSAMFADRVLMLAVVGSVLYWSILSLMGQNLYVYARQITLAMAHAEIYSGLPPALFGVGIGVGAVLAGRLSAAKVEVGLIPLGAVIFSIMGLLLGLIEPRLPGTLGLMLVMGLGAGFMVVPIHALIQWRSPADRRGAVIAVTNVVTLAGVIAGSLGASGLAETGLDSGGLLLVSAGIVIACTLWALWLLPDALLRVLLVLLTHTFYRLKVINRQHAPEEGGALLVPNHVTFLDGLFILASLDRPVRFIVDATYYNKWWARPFMQALGAIPITTSGGPRAVMRALRLAGQYLDEGHLVCIFAEGQLTRTGTLMPFRRGMERIVKGRDVPIIPMHLDRIWGSIFSYIGGRFVTKLPQQLPYPVTVSFGEPLPSSTPVQEVRQVIQRLGTDAWQHRRADRRPLQRTFIRMARHRPFGPAFAEATRPRVSRIKALAGAIALARAMRTHWANQKRVGLLLPPSIAAATANLAAALAGRTSVNLNYTAGPAAMTSAAQQAELTTVLTSRAFIEKAKLTIPKGVHPLFIEDLVTKISNSRRIGCLLLAWFARVKTIERLCGADKPVTLDDEATIIFSSGSTGDPKGVVLTHFNIDSNVEAVAQIFPSRHGDHMLGILPLFHSFGYMTMWLAINHDMAIVFHPNPLDADTVGRLVEKHRITVLIATPTFLQLYLRRVSPHAFGSLRVVLTGAEKLPARVSEAFEETFGIRPIEGYGATECSPVITASTLDVRYEGVFQAGSRRGSVGLPLPGVSVKLVDPESLAPLPADGQTPGMLLVRGPNIMKGYLNRPDLTEKVMRDGWYVTGDMARIDDDGFVFITDRLSRFSKIGGEMVPHGKVEDALHDAANLTMQTFAVTAIPDAKKGERLAVLHTYDPAKIPELVEKLVAAGLPNLFIPRADQFLKVDALPLLGTGKLDLRELKRRAAEAFPPAGA
ncbi:MAG: MFS transporter [Planctomycetes bacterium]|nr:MFS transporter [Planctomycetota bacterium]